MRIAHRSVFSSQRVAALAVVAAAAIGAVVAYLPSISGEFQFDDFDFVEADATGSDWAVGVRERSPAPQLPQ